MTAGTVLRTAGKSAVRRPIAAALILIVVAAASAITLLGLTLLTNANEAFLTSFREHRGADVAASVSTRHATRADLAATRHAPGVIRAAGPYPALTVTLTQTSRAGHVASVSQSATTRGGATVIQAGTGPTTSVATAGTSSVAGEPVGPASLGGQSRGPAAVGGTGPTGHGVAPRTNTSPSVKPAPAGMSGTPAGPTGPGGTAGPTSSTQTIVGRASPAGPLDDLTVGPGRWLTGRGQIVLAPYFGTDAPVGSTVTVTSAPGQPHLRVVGYAASTGRFGEGWVTPSELAALRPTQRAGTVQMLYRFRHAATALQVSADVTAVRARLPTGALRSYDSWLDSASQTGGEQLSDTAFVLAFALLGVIVAVIIVASLVSGAVVAEYRRIGVLKSIGFTPGQVAGTYVTQATIPAAGGVLIGAVIGNVWVAPQLNTAAGLLGAGAQHVPVWLNFATAFGMLTLVALAAVVPARRAARLSAVQAITAGQSPQTERGRLVQRITARLALPRPVTLGLAAPLTRPSRAATLLVASAAGATAILLSVGLSSSLHTVNELTYVGNGQVSVGIPKGSTQVTMSSRQSRTLLAAIRRQPGTRRVVGVDDRGATINSISALGIDNLNTVSYAGNAAWLDWPMITGHWYQAPDQLVVNAGFLAETGLRVGQGLTLQVGHHPKPTMIVGEIYQPNGPSLFTSAQTLGGGPAGLRPTHYAIQLHHGVNPADYAAALQHAIGNRFAAAPAGSKDEAGGGFDTFLIGLLTVLIGVLAGLGVLSAVLMLARERIHDLGIFKAVGMTPRQTLVTIASTVIAPATLAAAISIPVAILLHTRTVNGIGSLTGSGFPPAAIRIYHPLQVALLALSGIGLALLGALAPAAWAAAARTTTSLRTE